MESLFPGMFEEMLAGGSVLADGALDVWWFSNGVWRAQAKTGIISYVQSRPYLEFSVRRQVLRRANVKEQCCTVVSLEFGSRKQVTGARVRDAAGSGALSADLVVDCTGRGSQIAAWLGATGWPRPAVSRIEVNVGYSTRTFVLNESPPWKVLLVLGHAPAISRLGVMFPLEDGQWMVSLCGQFRDYPPDDEHKFLEFARSLARPELFEIIRKGRPNSSIATYRFPAHQWNHYEQVERPGGLLLLGDSICSFSPLYGQGMTVAALEAEVLQRCPATRGTADWSALARAYYRGILGPIRSAWDLATGADLAYPQTIGPRPRIGEWIGRYVGHVIALTSYDRVVLQEWVAVTNMLKPNSALFHPRVATRVIRRAIAGGPALPTTEPLKM